MPHRFNLKHRALLPLLAIVPLVAACTTATDSPSVGAAPSPAETAPKQMHADTEFQAAEKEHTARIGVFALDTGTGETLGYRQDERFGMGSTFKTLAVAALLHAHPLSSGFFDQVVHFTQDDIVSASPVTSTRVDTGMTVRELSDAAITHSDNTAGNQLLKLLGGPESLTAFVRTLGDTVTRLDRWEPLLNTNIPGDERDTSTPAALAADYRALVLGDALATPERDQLTAWLLANTTGDARIRAALPHDWKTGDKTGTGDYGSANDVAVTWPSGANAPLVIAILTTHPDNPAAAPDNSLVAATAETALSTLHH